jgi:acetyl-CoA C-acetyltransferase
MAIDPRTPVIAGVGQLVRRPDRLATADDLLAAAEPVEMMAEALRRAQADSGARHDLLVRAGSVRTVAMLSWRYADAGAELARRVHATPAETVVTATGGNGPQALVSDTCLAIQRGDLDVALLAGAEAVYTRLRARALQVRLPWTPMAEAPPHATRTIGHEKPAVNDIEGEVALVAPPVVYPVFENALRHAAGRSIDEHQRAISRLWSRFSEIAATNPHAWSPRAMTADAIATPSAQNRMIAFPYPKLLNANIQTDQAAALILCSLAAARAAGVDDDRLVFPLAGADGHDHWWISSRHDLHSSPAIAACGRALAAATGIEPAAAGHVDLYSCFPSAVQIGAAALGVDRHRDRDLTVTGGLTFGGGPGNNYATHSIATMVERLRADPGTVGLCTALGWYLTKHSLGLYSTTPPTHGFRHADVQPVVDATPSRPFTSAEDGPVVVESYTVTYERDGTPARGIAACLLPGGRRTWAATTDPDTVERMTTEEVCGLAARIDGGELRL